MRASTAAPPLDTFLGLGDFDLGIALLGGVSET